MENTEHFSMCRSSILIGYDSRLWMWVFEFNKLFLLTFCDRTVKCQRQWLDNNKTFSYEGIRIGFRSFRVDSCAVPNRVPTEGYPPKGNVRIDIGLMVLDFREQNSVVNDCIFNRSLADYTSSRSLFVSETTILGHSVTVSRLCFLPGNPVCSWPFMMCIGFVHFCVFHWKKKETYNAITRVELNANNPNHNRSYGRNKRS